ncbi:RNA polymerase sigma factor [Anaeromyxobacter dehalogenans]|uniref:RNA polymerase, sigma subunit, ECF family n=1 Tax=Anaeromyxobacter dehalogenans (strain 2CP-C) TaxID=290397 RepID=Q2INF0_ANADE|nr:RNA polymerase sigma factor [Anaeromyxobacter dehalogenans]ABC80333.1 RNA polymerase, sigma subunit, ECF family [Anaeromyxobacter dehalogenans 2CP-C]
MTASQDDDIGRIVRETAPRLYRLAARLTGDLAEAEDVLQESYVRACAGLGGRAFQRRSSIETWLHRIVVNASLDALRARRRRSARETHAAPADEVLDPGASLEARAALRELSEWLDELPAEQRVALVLKEIEGHSASEVARLLGCSEGAVEQRLVRARTFLRERRKHA